MQKTDTGDETRELNDKDFARAIPRRQRGRILSGCIVGGGDVVALRLFIGLTQQRFGEDLEPGAPRALMNVPEGTTGADATRDGERFLVAAGPERERDIRLILNWTSLLKR